MACWISAPTVSVVVVVGVGETTKGKDEEVAAPTTLGEVVVDEVGDETADVLVTGSDEEVVDSTAAVEVQTGDLWSKQDSPRLPPR
jgi:hypothetical protein